MKLRFDWGLGAKAFLACLVFVPIGILVRKYIAYIPLRFGVEVVGCAGVYFLIQLFVFKESQIRGIYVSVFKRGLK
jgi:hypothetical protein